MKYFIRIPNKLAFKRNNNDNNIYLEYLKARARGSCAGKNYCALSGNSFIRKNIVVKMVRWLGTGGKQEF